MFNKRGFTLIEIIVVILLLSSVSAVTVVGITNAKKDDSSKEKCEKNAKLCAEVYLSDSPDTGCIPLEDLIKKGCLAEEDNCSDYVNKYAVKNEGMVSLSNTKPNGICNINGSKYKLEIVSNYKDSGNLSDKLIDIAKESNQYSETENIPVGLLKSSDNSGTTYYIHGTYDKNYVSFAGLLWKVVRINGDGTIRLILNESIGKSKFQDTYEHTSGGVEKYAGYTYANSHKCTTSNPCKSNEGTSSTVKTFLENWYQTNISDKGYDNYVAESYYCNDTSSTKGDYEMLYYSSKSKNQKNYYFFGTADRQINTYNKEASNKFSFKCPTPKSTYGGYYKLKVGLLNADESYFAGDYSSYLSGAKGSITMSPKFITTSGSSYNLFFQHIGAYNGYNITNCNNKYYVPSTLYDNRYRYDTYWGNSSSLCDTSAEKNTDIYPVINLKANTIVTGTGYRWDPFVIDDSIDKNNTETIMYFPNEKDNIELNLDNNYYKTMSCVYSDNNKEAKFTYKDGILDLEEAKNTKCTVDYEKLTHYIFLKSWYGPNRVSNYDYIYDYDIKGGTVERIEDNEGHNNALKVLITDSNFELNLQVLVHGEESEGSQLWSYMPADYDIGVFDQVSSGYVSYSGLSNEEVYLVQFKGISSSFKNNQITSMTTEHYVSGYSGDGNDCYTCTSYINDECVSWSHYAC